MTYEAPNEANTASGFVPSNNAYKPTQGAIRHSEDTEFNEALRARGILPPKPQPARELSPDLDGLAVDRIETADLNDDDDLLDLEDDIPQAVLEQYRANRIQEVKKLARTRRFGAVIPIGRDEYTREITEASQVDLDGEIQDFEELKGKGTGVVCFLWKDSIPESQLMERHLKELAAAYPSTKFVSIRGDMCIANYPDRNIPTLLIYRRGELIKQIIGMGPNVGLKGIKTSFTELEALLTIADAVDPFLKIQPIVRQESEEESDNDEAEVGAGGRTRRRAYHQSNTRGSNNDDDFDL